MGSFFIIVVAVEHRDAERATGFERRKLLRTGAAGPGGELVSLHFEILDTLGRQGPIVAGRLFGTRARREKKQAGRGGKTEEERGLPRSTRQRGERHGEREGMRSSAMSSARKHEGSFS